MEKLLPEIRNAVRAVIFDNRHVLMQKKYTEEKGIYYTLPGGGQETGETLLQTLQRECSEEIGTQVTPKNIVLLADFFKQKSSPNKSIRHQLEILFYCQINTDYSPHNGNHPDKGQIGVEWLPLEHIQNFKLMPEFLSDVLPKIALDKETLYLGKSA